MRREATEKAPLSTQFKTVEARGLAARASRQDPRPVGNEKYQWHELMQSLQTVQQNGQVLEYDAKSGVTRATKVFWPTWSHEKPRSQFSFLTREYINPDLIWWLHARRPQHGIFVWCVNMFVVSGLTFLFFGRSALRWPTVRDFTSHGMPVG